MSNAHAKLLLKNLTCLTEGLKSTCLQYNCWKKINQGGWTKEFKVNHTFFKNCPRFALFQLLFFSVQKQKQPTAISKLQMKCRLSVKMSLLLMLLQTFCPALPAPVQLLSLLSSTTPSLWLCQCKNSMSACWDVSPVLTMDRIRDREGDTQKKWPERERDKVQVNWDHYHLTSY